MKTIISRYALYSLIAIEVLLMPYLVSSEFYIELEYYKFIVFFFPFVLVGAQSGFLYYNYTEKQDKFITLLLFGAIHALFCSLVFYNYSGQFLYSVSAFLMVMMVIIEQRVQVARHFTLALMVKPLISIFLIGFASLSYFYPSLGFEKIIFIGAFLSTFIIWSSAAFFSLRDKLNFREVGTLKDYTNLIKKGFFINVSTLLLMGMFFLDREIIKEYHPDFIGTYSFSFNISQFVILALTTIGYVNTVNLGESVANIDFDKIFKNLLFTYKIYFVLVVLFLIFISILDKFYEFPDLMLIAMIQVAFVGNFFSINSISAVALYKGMQKKMTAIFFGIFIVNIAFSYIFILNDTVYWAQLLKTGILLNVYSCFLLYSVYKSTSKKDF
ncbi:hypothetical protein A7985_17225 [Pseudoalteromonas luteoviolacea]|uniref:Polysaccharide biosynthesis protein C-terminal domain-containing protein n=1 Tax=Pseudoalteromonas luteoviolacea TaxID=43657 RepID=A0A1C0TNB6_9GAMM|nr:hypothetical protein [Pseudoalteromonas luteoviolacea]OCQ20174.1 hypothetical protein A7985_17225 [Pseudoalteromonas luteoviolacea]